jgi:uncharacterized membrane protein
MAGAVILAIVAFAAMIPGCEAADPWEEASCPKSGTTLTYENFGARFLAAACNECHSRHVKERHGAPEGYFFDTRDDVVQWQEHIYERSAGANDSMPPGPDDPSVDDRKKLAEWLACGAP